MEENVENVEGRGKKKIKKSIESGIIYLSRVPTLMNVTIVRRHFEKFGEIGRIFLQPDLKAKSRGKKRGRTFSEGWVEFMNKKVAKKVASALNNTLIGGKKKNKWREELWNIKYLHRFKWAHLNERLAYEKAVHSQRMRAEISQAKREAEFYIQNAEKNDRQNKWDRRRRKKPQAGGDKLVGDSDKVIGGTDNVVGQDSVDSRFQQAYQINFKETEEEIVKKRRLGSGTFSGLGKSGVDGARPSERTRKTSFLTKIFSAGLNSDEGE